jgi:glycosyltransferase involved in cell wall biosynthesis
LLAILLESFSTEDMPMTDCELLVVDNGSTDNTHSMVQLFQARLPCLRYIFEEQIGASYARNRGWQEARGDYIAFLDDDSKVPPQWVKKVREIIAELAPLLFGGPYYPFYLTPKPAWFKDDYGSNVKTTYACFTDDESFISAGNMCIRRDLLEQENGFREDMGPRDDKVAYGEETYLYRRLVAQHGKCIYFDPDIFIYHLVRAEKMHLTTLFKMQFASGRDYYYAVLTNGYSGNLLSRGGKGILSSMRQILRFLHHLIRFPFRDKQKNFYVQQYLYEALSHDIFRMGILYSITRSKLKIGPSK